MVQRGKVDKTKGKKYRKIEGQIAKCYDRQFFKSQEQTTKGFEKIVGDLLATDKSCKILPWRQGDIESASKSYLKHSSPSTQKLQGYVDNCFLKKGVYPYTHFMVVYNKENDTIIIELVKDKLSNRLIILYRDKIYPKESMCIMTYGQQLPKVMNPINLERAIFR